LLGLIGLYGIVYQVRVIDKARGLSNYRPDLEDWIWFTILPFLAYVAILGGAVLLLTIPVDALFAFAAGVMLMIVLGIRNAWDVVTFIAIGGADQLPDAKASSRSDETRA
jgi:membrane protein implicated in regulation of membrane protease activity